MTSRSSSWSASPTWVDPVSPARRPGRPALRPATGRQVGAPRRALRLGDAGRRAPDRAAMAALLALWVALWAVFVAGVVVPAAGLHRANAAPGEPASGAAVARAAR